MTTVKDLDIHEKRRLASRQFGFVRHYVYRTKSLIEPPRNSPHHASDEDRLDKDFDRSLKVDNENRKKKEAAWRAYRSTRQANKEQKLYEDRERQWEKKLQHDYYLKVKPQYRNKGGLPYDFLTMEYDDSYEGRKLKYLEDRALWREGLRRLRLQSKMSGTRNFNVITWKKTTPMQVPPEPEPVPERAPPRPCTAPPPPPNIPIIKVDAPRPISATVENKTGDREPYPWDLFLYRQRPYRVK